MDARILFGLLLVLVSATVYGNAPEHSHVDIDLTTGVVRGYSEQIRFLLAPTQSQEKSGHKGTGVGQGQRCSRRAIIRVDFDSNRYKVARVVLKYGESPRRWTFDASDSPMADGYGSVVSLSAPASSNQAATTEIHVMNRQLRVYGRWPAPSHNLYGRSSNKPESEGHSEAEEEESEEAVDMDESEETEEVEADPVASQCEEDDEDGGKCGGMPSTPSSDIPNLSPYPGSRMFMRVLDGTIRPNSRVELLVGAKGKSLWWRDGRLAHDLPAPPGFLRRRGSSLYLSFNRVLAGEWRAGVGLCSVSVQMMEAEDQCPRGQNFCDKNAICKPSRRGYQCSCKKGWQGDGKSCIDIDECRIKNGGCAHICHNEAGSYSCSCLKGFIQDPADPNNCIDVNECTTKTEIGTLMHSCEQICKNVMGSYECDCRDGYYLASDGRSCIAGTQPCPPQLGCKHSCEVDFSSHVGTKVGIKCTCPAGHSLDERDMKSCLPSCSVGNGGCQHHCHEVPIRNASVHKGMIISSWRPVCTCQPKYILGPDGKSCSASCSVNNGGCQKRCTTTDTGVVCSCPIGYILNRDGKSCTDVDECTSGNVTCEYGCANSVGSFECICPPGYRLNPVDERTCLDMDDCSIENTCEQKCVNLPGSYQCECEEGYQLFGVSHCGDVNECLMDNGGCSHNCINTEGSYYCTCNNEYKLHANGKDCIGVETSNSLSCGQQTKYRSVSGESSGEAASSNAQRCLDSVSSPRYMMTARFFFTGTKCTSLVQMKATSDALIEELNANNIETCSNECRLQVSKVRCENSKRVLKKLGKEKGDVVRVVFQIVSHPSNNSASCRGNCVRKSSSRILWQAATHLKRSLNGARFSVKPLDEELIIIPKSFHARRNIQQTCYESTNTSKEICGFCPSGTFSSTGYLPCQPCPMGTYQPYQGRLNCIPTSAKSNSIRGAKSFPEASAIEPCAPGKFYSRDLKSCDFCPKGTYQHLSGQNYCIQCPGNSSTDHIGSKHVDECKRSKCVSFINDLYGVIESPNYPGNYPTNLNCTWIVKPGRGRRLLVIVPDIKLANDNCGDYLVMRKSKSPYSVTTYEACKSSNHPIAFTARSKRLWMQFKSNGNNTAGGFQIPFVTYNEEYQVLIEDIVQDSRLYSSVNHLRILQTAYNQQFLVQKNEKRVWKDLSIKLRQICRYIFTGRQRLHAINLNYIQDRKLLLALMEVIAQPINYYKYASDQRKILPSSFIRLMTPKVRKFFSYR